MYQATKYLPHDFVCEFIEKYRNLPCLWKIRSEDYSNKVKRLAAYEQLVELCKKIDQDANIDYVKAKIATFRGSFRKELEKVLDSKKSGAGEEVYTPKLWYFDLMLFATDQEIPWESVSNLTDLQMQDSQEKTDERDDERNSDRAGESTAEPSPSTSILETYGKTETPGEKVSSFRKPVHVLCNKRKRDIDDQKRKLLEKAEKCLDDEEDEFDAFGKFVAKRLRQLSELQYLYAEKQIMEILYNCSRNTITSSSSFPLSNENQRGTKQTNNHSNGASQEGSSLFSLSSENQRNIVENTNFTGSCEEEERLSYLSL